MQAIDRLETKNAEVYYNAARPFARLSGRNQAYEINLNFNDEYIINNLFSVLHQALSLTDRAKTLQPENSDYVTEYAFIQEMLGMLSYC